MNSPLVYGLETDNFLSWGIQLADSSEVINSLVATQINDALIESNSQPEKQTCQDVTFEIAKKFKTTPSRKIFEDWTVENLKEDQMFPVSPYHLAESIYKDTSRFYMKYSGLSSNIQMNGIYFGVDKLSHFGSTGRRYLKKYLKGLSKGLTDEEAQKETIIFGLGNEAGVLGIWASGVFSYGDIEANYQGFLFYKNLCLNKSENYLGQDEIGKWHLRVKPDLRKYVNPYWDESFNHSYMSNGTWAKTSLNIKKDYCHLVKDEKVVERKAFYQSNLGQESFSHKYVSDLQKQGYERAPFPQLSFFCR